MLAWESRKIFSPFNVSLCHYSKIIFKAGDLSESISLSVFPLCRKLEANVGTLTTIRCNLVMELFTVLNLSNNNISDLEFILNVPNLAVLELSNNKLVSAALGPLKSLTGLELLEISYNLLTNIDVIQNKSLKVLFASHNEISELDFISKCVNIQELNLAYNALKDSKSISRLYFLDRMQTLNLSNNLFKRVGDLEFLSKMSICSFNFLNNPFVVQNNEYFQMFYINIFSRCSNLNGIMISPEDVINAILFFRKKKSSFIRETQISSFDLLYKKPPYSRIVVIMPMGVSYASKLTKEAPLLYSTLAVANKIELCAHKFVSWIDETTLVVYDGSTVISHPHQLKIKLLNDEYDYYRFRTTVTEFVLNC